MIANGGCLLAVSLASNVCLGRPMKRSSPFRPPRGAAPAVSGLAEHYSTASQ